MLKKAIPAATDAAEFIRQIKEKAAFYQSQTTSSTEYSPPSTSNEGCAKCNWTGSIVELEKVPTNIVGINGKPFVIERIKVDSTTGRPPLCECQKGRLFAKYNASSGMKSSERQRYFETADIDDENRAAFDQVRRITDNLSTHLQNGSVVYIFGDPDRAAQNKVSAYGTGKSYLTHCIGNELTCRKQHAIYVTEDKLFAEIKATYSRDADESESDVLSRYQNVPILLIDDLFKSKTTDWTEDKLFHLLNSRLEPGKMTVINSNYAPNRIHLTMPRNGAAISSRIIGQSILIEMIGKDRRRVKKSAAIEPRRDIDPNGKRKWFDREDG